MAIHPTDTGDKLHTDNQDVIEDNSAPRERSAEEVAPDTVLRANIEDAIENISKSAMADNGTLQQGDSPEASL